MVGGNDDTESLGDVHCLSLDRGVWQNIGPGVGTPPKPRHCHTATIVGNYMIVSGEPQPSAHAMAVLAMDAAAVQPERASWIESVEPLLRDAWTAGGTHQPSPTALDTSPRRCTDTWVMDLETQAWECLHEWQAAGKMYNHAMYTAAHEKRVFTLKPSPEKPHNLCGEHRVARGATA